MKKRILIVAVLALALAAAGCGKKTDTKTTQKAQETVKETAKETAKETVKETEAATNPVEEIVDDASKAVDEAVEAVSEGVEEVADDASKAVDEAVEAVSEGVDEAVEAVSEGAKELASEAEEAVEAVSEGADELASEVEEAVENVSEAVEEAATAPFEFAEESSEEALEPVEVDYAGFMEAELDTPVIVETYVQATQSWWDNSITVYGQSEDGAIFIYGMECSEEDAEKLVPGTKIRVTGYKSEWAGEVEIMDGTFEILEADAFIAEPKDVTELLGKDELIDYMNQKVSFTGLKVAASKDADGNEVAFLYNWDGSGTHEDNSDLYFNVEAGDATYTLTVESYLCNNESDVYAAVEKLEIGQEIDAEGFLYWYNGANPHITSITVK